MATQDYRNKLGEKIPGNTTIIGSNLGWKTGGLVHWAWDLGMKGQDYRKVRDEAGGVGTVVHSRIEAAIHQRPQPNETWFWEWIKDDEKAAKKAYDAVENAMLAFHYRVLFGTQLFYLTENPNTPLVRHLLLFGLLQP